ncbi:MAG: FAD-dependent oxidoreductase [Mobilicoccus sp.]|nr:FAD-dependent oxidoreductase [Mobilicoccus sp.]
MERVIVVGAGVTGLSCAVRLLEAGHEVHVLARDLPPETTSAVSAALWYPYKATLQPRVQEWGARAYEVFTELADIEGTGVRLRRGTEMLRSAAPDPTWVHGLRDYARTDDASEPYVASRSFVSPVADMSIYLPWLRTRVAELGGTVTRLPLADLPRPEHGVVVNTAGLGARGLAHDSTITPNRGQVVVVAQFGLTEWSLDDAGPTYLVPREETVIVGGTALDDEWNVQPDPALAPGFLARAHDLLLHTGDPALADRLRRADVLAHRVGLRPVRPTVRLEEEVQGSTRVIHCYGHGGAGMTLSWGCAEDVTALLA